MFSRIFNLCHLLVFTFFACNFLSNSNAFALQSVTPADHMYKVSNDLEDKNSLRYYVNKDPSFEKPVKPAKEIKEPVKYKYDSGTGYFRIGGGAVFNNIVANVSLLGDRGNPSNVDNQGGIGGLLNLELGFNYYSQGNFFFSTALSTDLIFGAVNSALYDNGNLQASNMPGTSISSINLELKFKFGANFRAGPVRVVPYVLVGLASNIAYGEKYTANQIGNTNYFKWTSQGNGFKPFFGADFGAGLVIASRKLPIGWFVEFTVPTFFVIQPGFTEVDSAVIGGGSFSTYLQTPSELDIIMTPRFATGIQIGF